MKYRTCEVINGGRITRASSVDQMGTEPGQPGALPTGPRRPLPTPGSCRAPAGWTRGPRATLNHRPGWAALGPKPSTPLKMSPVLHSLLGHPLPWTVPTLTVRALAHPAHVRGACTQTPPCSVRGQLPGELPGGTPPRGREVPAPGHRAWQEHRAVWTSDAKLTPLQVEKTSFQKTFNILLCFFLSFFSHATHHPQPGIKPTAFAPQARSLHH